ncbi:hypothetical protein MB901379_03788 [Mycobacterium basiliense]|uniref:Uncharacterized protein n=1 Tax=Mycobacterium basiliense TaxID=2094119 RepID=A0A3S4FT71_9MYCO|nr:hypothetical protein MB901379_03788 [Mycobacterium basiliense]
MGTSPLLKSTVESAASAAARTSATSRPRSRTCAIAAPAAATSSEWLGLPKIEPTWSPPGEDAGQLQSDLSVAAYDDDARHGLRR